MTKSKFYSLRHQARLLLYNKRGMRRWEAANLICLLADLEHYGDTVAYTMYTVNCLPSLALRLARFKKDKQAQASMYASGIN